MQNTSGTAAVTAERSVRTETSVRESVSEIGKGTGHIGTTTESIESEKERGSARGAIETSGENSKRIGKERS